MYRKTSANNMLYGKQLISSKTFCKNNNKNIRKILRKKFQYIFFFTVHFIKILVHLKIILRKDISGVKN